MKVTVIQPYYSREEADLEKCFQGMLDLLETYGPGSDLIVLPEYGDIPAKTQSKENFHRAIETYNGRMTAAAEEAARRFSAIVCFNAAAITENGPRNTTRVLDRQGREVGRYYKAHPAPGEVKTAAAGGNEIDCSYSYDFAPPTIVEVEGLRLAFLTCYDFYFYESFARIAREKPDLIIGCSHQRTDSHRALDLFNGNVAYQTDAYLVRSSVSLGEDSPVGGCSCVIAPDGTVLADLKSRVGGATVEIDPKKHFEKPAGFGGAIKSHPAYIEEGRRPWLYRNAGPGVIRGEKDLPYPRICAHRGFSQAIPENTIPALAAAVGLGANEIEFDVWPTADGELVSCHDSDLERVSNGTGRVWEHTLAELLKLDFGGNFSPAFKGLRIPRFEEILRAFGGRVIMNIHVKMDEELKEYFGGVWYDETLMKKIVALLRQYDCADHAYFVLSRDEAIRQFASYAPDIPVCVGNGGSKAPYDLVDRAIALGCKKVQFFKPYFRQQDIDRAHEHGILCNVFWADNPSEAVLYADMGMDCIMTNNFIAVSNRLKKHWASGVKGMKEDQA
ncbi:MAG: hypothetical protein II776_01675 [Clostridia bacterium]|nr:hypothetical protein [Clostridia bacterium]